MVGDRWRASALARERSAPALRDASGACCNAALESRRGVCWPLAPARPSPENSTPCCELHAALRGAVPSPRCTVGSVLGAGVPGGAVRRLSGQAELLPLTSRRRPRARWRKGRRESTAATPRRPAEAWAVTASSWRGAAVVHAAPGARGRTERERRSAARVWSCWDDGAPTVGFAAAALSSLSPPNWLCAELWTSGGFCGAEKSNQNHARRCARGGCSRQVVQRAASLAKVRGGTCWRRGCKGCRACARPQRSARRAAAVAPRPA